MFKFVSKSELIEFNKLLTEIIHKLLVKHTLIFCPLRQMLKRYFCISLTNSLHSGKTKCPVTSSFRLAVTPTWWGSGGLSFSAHLFKWLDVAASCKTSAS